MFKGNECQNVPEFHAKRNYRLIYIDYLFLFLHSSHLNHLMSWVLIGTWPSIHHFCAAAFPQIALPSAVGSGRERHIVVGTWHKVQGIQEKSMAGCPKGVP